MRSIFILALTLSVITTVATGKNAKPQKPNILIFLADDLGIGDVGCFGNTTLPTPNIDSLAREGVKMNHFLTAAALCTPSRAAFLTGRYPVRSGMAGIHWNPVTLITACKSTLPRSEITFAEIAKEAGYKTGIIGKWHLGMHQNWPNDNANSPINQGFDYWFGIPNSNLREFDPEELPTLVLAYPNAKIIAFTAILAEVIFFEFLRRKHFIGFWKSLICSSICALLIYFPVWTATHGLFLNSMLYRNKELVEQPMILDGMTKRLVNEGVEFIQERHKDGEPFLLFMSWLQVHTALHAGPEFRGKSKHGRYGDEVMELDWSVGEVLKALDNYGMANNTMVFFSSDHGGHVEDHGRTGERQGGYNGIYRGGKLQGGMDGAIRVPTVMRWPGYIKPGSTIDVPLSNMDIFTTIADIVGVPPPKDRQIDGKNLVPLLKGLTEETPHDHLIHYCTNLIHAVRFRPDKVGVVWKVRYASPKWLPGTEGCNFACRCSEMDNIFHDPPLVFDMTNNPREDEPLPESDPKHREVVQKAKEVIGKHRDGLAQVEDQLSLLNSFFRPHLQPCCNFPYCTCTDTKKYNLDG